MRNCDGCTKCCEGYLSGTARGAFFGNLISCKFLNKVCTIYSERPSTCYRYQCAWTQELLPVWMKPSEIDLIVSVENDDNGKQFLKAVSPNELETDHKDELEIFCKSKLTDDR